MVEVILVLAAAAIVAVVAEAPIGREYLPVKHRGCNRPFPLLWTLQRSFRQILSFSFGRSNGGLSGRYSTAPLTSRRFNSLSTRYRIPSSAFRRFGASSIQYGSPIATSPFNASSTKFGAPSHEYDSLSNGYNAPSSQFGPPAASNRFATPSTQYGAPSLASNRSNALSNTYGTPSDFSRGFDAPAIQYSVPFGGYRAQKDHLSEPANYELNYEVQDAESGAELGHEETRRDETAQGSYRVLLPDGCLQIVEYQADEEGYKPEIRYEETAYSRNSQGPYPASRAGPY